MRIGRGSITLTSLLVFISAFLLFIVQPMAGKELLPVWGGSASVWTACLAFFQACLLIGYLIAFLSAKTLSTVGQAMVQGSLFLLAMAWVWIPWQIDSELSNPALGVLVSLSLSLAFPAIALSTSTPVGSHWRGQSESGREPYSLYALSNAGGLMGCLAYPFVVEPRFSLPTQQWIWKIVLSGLAIGWLIACLQRARQSVKATERLSNADRPTSAQSPSAVAPTAFWQVVLWFVLPWSTAILLAASTHQLSQAGVVVPGLWVMPLAIYLVTWWLSFSGCCPSRWGGQMWLFYIGAIAALVLIIFKLWLPWLVILAGYAVVLWCIGASCHGLLYSLRPAVSHLTSYYLAISVGGVLGTTSALWLAPQWFSDYYELQIGLAIAAVAIALHYFLQFTPQISGDVWVRRWKWPVNVGVPSVFLLALWTHAATPSLEKMIAQRRDFYGVVRVVDHIKRDFRAMVLGQTIHGVEPLEGELDVDRSMYYGTRSGVACAWGWTRQRTNRPLRVGAIGLGTGTLSMYAARQDHLVYYEISPAVIEMAEQHFRYLRSHQGSTDIRVGDGRTLIANEVSKGDSVYPLLDLLFIDAFTNDSIPMHLLTVEAIQLYRQRLTTDGIIALNITNRNLDLAPVLFQAAVETGHQPLLIEHPIDRPDPDDASHRAESDVRWLLLLPDGQPLPPWPNSRTALRDHAEAWTDAYGSLWQAFRLNTVQRR
ncbi:MAG: fused MFS/spermidine synthase [Pirellula sp.]|jgi:spermidine synthase|nr:fused MFS/spermidine synthase [Pirellula sp.]